jgi:hypothetical protein
MPSSSGVVEHEERDPAFVVAQAHVGMGDQAGPCLTACLAPLGITAARPHHLAWGHLRSSTGHAQKKPT